MLSHPFLKGPIIVLGDVNQIYPLSQGKSGVESLLSNSFKKGEKENEIFTGTDG